jgi:hypothetical protein
MIPLLPLGVRAHNLIVVPAAGFVIAAATGALIHARRKREDKRRREEFKNVCKLEDKLNRRTTAND